MVNTKKKSKAKKVKPQSEIVAKLLGGFAQLENLKGKGLVVIFNAKGKTKVFIEFNQLKELVDEINQIVKLKGGSNVTKK